jgi:exoribonuclease R
LSRSICFNFNTIEHFSTLIFFNAKNAVKSEKKKKKKKKKKKSKISNLFFFSSFNFSSLQFDYSKMELTAKLAVNRAVLHKKKRIEQSSKNKKEIATLLEQGKDALARVKTTAIVFEDYMVEVLNMVAIYCQTLVQRKDVMKIQQDCPKELKEACCSIIYAAPYLDGQDELRTLRLMLIKRYGKQFPQDCVNDNCVNPKLIQRLSKKQPDEDLINYYMGAIAKKHGVDRPDLFPLDKLADADSTPDASLHEVAAAPAPADEEIPGRALIDKKSGNMWVKHLHDNAFPLIFIAPADRNGAEDKDQVLCRLKARADGHKQGVITEMLERAKDEASVEYEAKLVLDAASGNHWAIHIADPSQPLAFVKPTDLAGGEPGDVVLLQLVPRADGNRQGKVLEVLQKAAKTHEIEAKVKVDKKTGHHWAIDRNDKAAKPVFSAARQSQRRAQRRPRRRARRATLEAGRHGARPRAAHH